MAQQETAPNTPIDAPVRLPVGMVEIGPGHAVRARDVCEVEFDHRSGETLIGLDFSGRQADADSPLPYAEIMRRLRRAQLDELAEPGDPEVVHLLREALEHLTEDRRRLLEATVRAAIGHAHQSGYPVSIGPDVLQDLAGLKAGEAYDPRRSAVAAADATDQLAEG